MMSLTDLHKFADIIFGMTQKLFYILYSILYSVLYHQTWSDTI